VAGNQRYHPFDMTIPSDFSSATFAAVAAVITRSEVTLTGLDFSDPQGDKQVFSILERMGATVNSGPSSVTISASEPLHGGEFDLNAIPDSLPALSVAAAAARGCTKFYNVNHARIKETDRIKVMCRELGAMGIDIREGTDGLTIQGGKLTGTRVNGHHDHRVVMALACAGMIADGETIITTAEAAEVTYPDFVKSFESLGARIESLS
jgi:3-phosphoshikimate 1-carboxyvinyltransferase